ncbi:MAG TPA: hypothetical protein VHM20_05825 [Gammaproteobacteria bacterium]|jgi:hypothetical protein|nr:hypothetical protein [Gammaproteobacteria bacterium]
MGLKIWLEEEKDYFVWFISDGQTTKHITFSKPSEEIKNSYDMGQFFTSWLTVLLGEFYQLKFGV